MRTSEASILFLPGRDNSPPEHWQSRWEAKLSTAHRVEQRDWAQPDRAPWVVNILAAVRGASRPVVLVTHSMGGIAALWAAREAPAGAIAGAFIVAPSSDAARASNPVAESSLAIAPREKLGFPAVLVASRNDPYADFAWSEALAAELGAHFVDAGEAGHINAVSGYGPWPEGLMRFGGFMRSL